jgi:hypothetical protein
VPGTLLLVTSVSATLAIGGVVLSSLLMTSHTDIIGVVPEGVSLALLLLFLSVMMVSCCGVSGTLFANRMLLGSYLCVSILMIIAQLFLGTYGLLYANNIQTFGGLDEATQGFTAEIEDAVVEWGLESDPSGFVALQDSLDCCGVNLRSTYEYNATAWQDLFTGPDCFNASRVDAFNDIHQKFDTYSEEAEVYAEGLLALGEDYFCSAALGSLIREYTLYLGIVFGLMLAAQFAAAICASILICW